MKLPICSNMKKYAIVLVALFVGPMSVKAQTDPTPLRVIVIGAHPDDCDLDAGGTAALFASMGHAVKFAPLF